MLIYLAPPRTDNLDEFLFYMSMFNSIITASNTNYCMMMGDLNADLKEDANGNLTQLFGRTLKQFCHNEDLVISDYERLNHSTTSYISASHGTTSWLDHIVSTHSMHKLISQVNIENGFITSDYLPVSVVLKAAFV